MRTDHIRNLLLATVLVVPALAGQVELERVELPGTEKGYAVVHRPAGPAPRGGFPVSFWYHGTYGSPDIGPIADRALRSLYVGIGMSYAVREGETSTERIVREDWRRCLSVLKHVARDSDVNRDRLVVGGVSRGGWTAYLIADQRPRGLIGAAITAAGKQLAVPEAGGRLKNPIAVLIGVGETDVNFAASQNALRYFNTIGAHVTYEEWPCEGHVFHLSPRLLDWFRVQAMDGHPELSRSLSAEFARATDAADDEEDRWQRFLRYLFVYGHPLWFRADPEMRNGISSALHEMSREPALRDAMARRKALHEIVTDEVALLAGSRATGSRMRRVFDAYRAFFRDHAVTEYGDRAVVAAERVAAWIEFQQKEDPSYGNSRRDRLQEQYTRLFEKARRNGNELPVDEFREMQDLRDTLDILEREAREKGPTPLVSAEERQVLAREVEQVRARMHRSPETLFPRGGLGR